MKRKETERVPRAAVYCRKSVARGLDREVNSLTTQRAACEDYCRAQGWEAVPVHYDDGGFTGRNTDRPAFQALMRDAAAGRFDKVVVYKLDRFSRSLADFVANLAELEKVGVGFTAVTQSFDTSTALGRLTMGILASFASFESDLNSERTKDAIAAGRRRGKWTGGKPPIGYASAEGALVVVPGEAAIARELFTLYLEFESSIAVVRELNARGRTTKAGRRWKKAAVLRALRSPILAGFIRAGDELVDGQHDAIIERGTWDRVQSMLDRHRDRGREPRPRNPEFLVSGRIRCGACGSAYTPVSAKKRRRVYRYYRCTKRDREGSDACTGQPLPAASVEDFVVDRVAEVARSPELADDVASRLGERIAAERVVLVEQQRAHLARLATANAEVGALVDRLVDTTTPVALRALEARISDRTDTRTELETRLAEIERQLAALSDAAVDSAWVAETLASFDYVWAVLTPTNRRRLIEALVREVTVDTAAATIAVELVDVTAETVRRAS